MSFDDLVRSRRSVRGFIPGKRPGWRLVVDAVDAANQIPMAGNIPFLRFVMVEDSDTISKIAEASQQSFISDASYVIAVCSNTEQLKRNFDSKGEVFAHQEAGAAIQNFLLKITDSGLASCWIGYFSDKIVKKLLDVPKDWDIEALLPVGFASPNVIGIKPSRDDTIKPKISDSLFFENFKTNKRER